MKKIFWIDLSSEGDAKFYSNAWYSVLNKDASFFVHKSNKYAHKLYNYGRANRNSKLFNLFLLIELSVLLFLLALTIKKKKYKVIINIYQPFIFYFIFLKILNFRNCQNFVIIHDVTEFDTKKYPKIIMSSNRKIIDLSEAVILHNEINRFKEIYSYNKEIFLISFPIREPYNGIYSNISLSDSLFNKSLPNYILFIGNYREEKGLEQLLTINKEDLGNHKLIVASNIPYSIEELFKKKFQDKVLIFNNSISDLDFEFLVKNATYGICPYLSGSNSGIYSTFVSNQIPTIVSNSPVFKSMLLIEDLIVKDNNYSKMIANLPSSDSDEYIEYKRKSYNFLTKRKLQFSQDVFNKIL